LLILMKAVSIVVCRARLCLTTAQSSAAEEVAAAEKGAEEEVEKGAEEEVEEAEVERVTVKRAAAVAASQTVAWLERMVVDVFIANCFFLQWMH
jgi:hypothetical protein